MTVVGSATVVIRAVTTKLREDIKKGLDSAARDASVGGDQAGKNFSQSFGQHIRSNVANSLQSVDFSAFQQKAKEGGQFSSLSFSQSFGAVDLSPFKNNVTQTMKDVDNTVVSSARNTSNKLATEGRNGGSRFSRAFGNGIDEGHIGARFRRIVLAILAIGPAILAALGGISALVSGLFAIASAATPALGTLALFPSALAALGASALTVGLAFGGIGKAVKALGAQQAAGGKTALNTAKQQETAARQIQAAEERLASAQERAKFAQQDLTRARIDAKERIEDLALSLRGSVLDEESATLRLKRAREAYNKSLISSSSTADDQAQASLDLREAELALDTARENRLDLQSEAAKASKAGVEGSDEVIQANRSIADANKDVISAQRDLAQAHKDAKTSMDSLGASAARTQNAFAGLSKEAAAFAKFLFANKKEFESLRAAAGKELFPKLTIALQNLITNFFPALREGLQSVGSAIGTAAITLSKAFTTPENLKNFRQYMKSLTPLIETVGKILAVLSGAFLSFLVQSAPALLRLSDIFLKLSIRFENFLKNGEKTGKVDKFLQRSLDTATFLAKILGNLTGLIFDLGKAAAPAGKDLLETFDNLITKTRKFTGSVEGQAKLKKFFEDVAKNVKPIAKLIGQIALAFLKLGADPNLGKIATQISDELLPAVGHLKDAFLDTVPELVTFARKVTDLFTVLAKSKAVEIFVRILGDFFDIVSNIMKTPVLGDIAFGLIAIAAGFKAISFAVKLTAIPYLIGRLTALKAALSGAAAATALPAAAAGAGAAGGGIVGGRGGKAAPPAGRALPKGTVVKGAGALGIGAVIGMSLDTKSVSSTFTGLATAAATGFAVGGPWGAAAAVAGTTFMSVLTTSAKKRAQEKATGKEIVAALQVSLKDAVDSVDAGSIQQSFDAINPKLKIDVTSPAEIDAILKVLNGSIKRGGFIAQKENKKLIDFMGQDTFNSIKKLGYNGQKALITMLNDIQKAQKELERRTRISEFVDTVVAQLTDAGVKGASAYKGQLVKGLTETGIKAENVAKLSAKQIAQNFIAHSKFTENQRAALAGDLGAAMQNAAQKTTARAPEIFGPVGKAGGFNIARGAQVTLDNSSLYPNATSLGKTALQALTEQGTAGGSRLANAVKTAAGKGSLKDLGKTTGQTFTAGVVEGTSKLADAVSRIFKLRLQTATTTVSVNFHGRGGIPAGAAKGGTVYPRSGGTLLRIAEAGRAESIVDAGLLNRRLAQDTASVAELRLIRQLLEHIDRLGGINIETLNATALTGQSDPSLSVPKALRSLAFELGV